MRRHFLLVFYCASFFVLSACASYQAKPLNHEASLKTNIADLRVDVKSLDFPELASYRLDIDGELDMTGLAILAVLNNPDLKVARDDAGIAHAQAFAAGLLPDPQLSLSTDLSNSSGANGSKAFSYGISFDVGALWLRSALLPAADAEAQKTDLNLLWQEWQVIAQTRLLYIKLIQNQKLVMLLNQHKQLLADRLTRAQAGLTKALLVSDAVLSNLSALQDLQKQLHDVERLVSQTRHELNALLGLKPDVNIRLRQDFALPALQDNQVLSALTNLAHRRADIMALEAAYQAQDQRYRAAVLAQFPSLNVGLTHAGDSSGVYSNGVGLTLSLPILNRNRGNIAIEKTTRQKLYDDYQQRLNIAHSDIHKILADQRIGRLQLQEIQTGLAQLTSAVRQMEIAFQHKNVDTFAYVNVMSALLAKQIEEINLQQMMLEQRVALQTLIGGDLPVVTPNINSNLTSNGSQLP